MSSWAAKRFWKQVEVVQQDDGFGVALDGRVVKTPLKRGLIVPTQELATEIAEEWHAQDKEIRPDTMPFTRSANAAIDKVADQFDEVAEMIAAYGDSDLLCYRADSPAELVARQARDWDPLLAWAEQVLNARLEIRTGVMHQAQQKSELDKLAARVAGFSNFQLTGFHDLVSLSGSLVLGFAVTEGFLNVEEAWQLSRVDENWQIEQWGVDEEAEIQANKKRDEFAHSAKFFSLS